MIAIVGCEGGQSSDASQGPTAGAGVAAVAQAALASPDEKRISKVDPSAEQSVALYELRPEYRFEGPLPRPDRPAPCGGRAPECRCGFPLCIPLGNGRSFWDCRDLASELRCDGSDDDCDGSTDEGLLNACGACGPVAEEQCNGRDDDCDGRTDEGLLNACGECGEVPVERCNGSDDDCDGSVDEGVRNACGTCGPVATEVCNGADDDCDGRTDEGNVCEDPKYHQVSCLCSDATATGVAVHAEMCLDASLDRATLVGVVNFNCGFLEREVEAITRLDATCRFGSLGSATGPCSILGQTINVRF